METALPEALQPTQEEHQAIKRLIKRLRPHRLKQIVPNRFGHGENDATLTPYLLQLLGGDWDTEAHWKEQTIAAWALGRVPLTEVQEEQAARLLADILGGRSMPRSRRWTGRLQRAALRTYGVTLTSIVLMGIVWFLSMLLQEGGVAGGWQGLLVLASAAPIVAFIAIIASLYPFHLSLFPHPAALGHA